MITVKTEWEIPEEKFEEFAQLLKQIKMLLNKSNSEEDNNKPIPAKARLKRQWFIDRVGKQVRRMYSTGKLEWITITDANIANLLYEGNHYDEIKYSDLQISDLKNFHYQNSQNIMEHSKAWFLEQVGKTIYRNGSKVSVKDLRTARRFFQQQEEKGWSFSI